MVTRLLRLSRFIFLMLYGEFHYEMLRLIGAGMTPRRISEPNLFRSPLLRLRQFQVRRTTRPDMVWFWPAFDGFGPRLVYIRQCAPAVCRWRRRVVKLKATVLMFDLVVRDQIRSLRQVLTHKTENSAA